MNGRVRYIDSVKFISDLPGNWYTDDRVFAAFHMLAGTANAQWELYRVCPGGDDCICDERRLGGQNHDRDEFAVMLDSTFTMNELEGIAAGEEFTKRRTRPTWRQRLARTADHYSGFPSLISVLIFLRSPIHHSAYVSKLNTSPVATSFTLNSKDCWFPVSPHELPPVMKNGLWYGIGDTLTRGELVSRYGRLAFSTSSLASAIAQAYPKAHPALAAEVVRVARAVGADPRHLASLIEFESAHQWSSRARHPVSGATGLIQFMPRTAKALGTSTVALARLSEVEQMKWVEKYLRQFRGPLDTKQKLYMAVFYPAAMRWPTSHAFPANVQRANPGIRTPADYVALVNRAEKLPTTPLRTGPISSSMTGLTDLQQRAAGIIESQLGAFPRSVIVAAIANAQAESGLNPGAVGSRGAKIGLFQLTEATGLDEDERFEPVTSAAWVAEELSEPGHDVLQAQARGIDLARLTGLFAGTIHGVQDPEDLRRRVAIARHIAGTVPTPPPHRPPVAREPIMTIQPYEEPDLVATTRPPAQAAVGGCSVVDPVAGEGFLLLVVGLVLLRRRSLPAHLS